MVGKLTQPQAALPFRPASVANSSTFAGVRGLLSQIGNQTEQMNVVRTVPKKIRANASASPSPIIGTSLVDWREPERNVHVLDWRERAHAFGLVPVDEHGEGGPLVIEPPEQLIAEEEPEAFDEQPVDEAERQELSAEEVEEAPDSHLPHEDVDLVRVYLKHVGRRKLLTAQQEQEIGRRIDNHQLDNLAADARFCTRCMGEPIRCRRVLSERDGTLFRPHREVSEHPP